MCRNGSLITIFRNCFLPGGSLKGCQGESDADSAGVGGKRFFYSISNDGKHPRTTPAVLNGLTNLALCLLAGGVGWTKPRAHPDLVTPVCQGSVTGYKQQLLFSGPYSETSRTNLTILASDDNGATFSRSLRITPGAAGYTGLQCGMPGDNDCAVVYDAGHKIDFVAFSSTDIK